MRPEFLNAYVSIAPTPEAVDNAYREIFPSFVGVNISSDIDPKIISEVQDRYVKKNTDQLFSLPKAQQEFQRKTAFYGVELVQDAHRLALMNLMLHGLA